ncbi:MAG: GNAT family acetyltransferase [Gammaproteobacteria bacterium]|nr:GNAT family acetyltransferase [Gammaproteobacteria bacterium]
MVRVLARFIYVDAMKCMALTMQTVDQSILSGEVSYDGKFLTESECLYFAGRNVTGLKADEIRQNFSKGDRCYAFIKEQEIASYGWYSTSTTELPNGHMLSFDRSYVYMYGGYTRGAYRGQGLHGKGMASALKFYHERGYKGLVSMVDSRNYESLRSIYRVGYRIFGRIYVFQIRNKCFVWRSPGSRKYGFVVTKPE